MASRKVFFRRALVHRAFLTAVDSESLIDEVEKQPVLWDPANEDYKDKNKKNAAWLEVSAAVIKNFNAKTESEQKLIVQDVTSKWRSIRDNYVRSKKKSHEMSKSGAAALPFKPYIHEERLRFLEKSYEVNPKPTTINEYHRVRQEKNENLGSKLKKSDAQIEKDDDVDVTDQSTLTTCKKLHAIKRPKRTSLSSSIEDDIDIDKLTTSFNNDARKPSKNLLAIEDEDVAFFNSLLPAVKTLTMDEKFAFRIQTMQLLQNIKRTSYANMSTSFSSAENSLSSSVDPFSST